MMMVVVVVVDLVDNRKVDLNLDKDLFVVDRDFVDNHHLLRKNTIFK
jgi:hypothetical protein